MCPHHRQIMKKLKIPHRELMHPYSLLQLP